MHGQRIDQVARSLAGGLSRRSALKGAAVALGLSAAGVLTSPALAAPPWCGCTFTCGAGGIVQVCAHHCRPKLPSRQGTTSCTLATDVCGFASEQACYEAFPI
jgi:hypothetical protein